ncbi:MAG: hypothetical protein HRT73_08535 [Flavobacteriales bacterium]|nr:hypothetical protein [Flavobacteriales bacterium]
MGDRDFYMYCLVDFNEFEEEELITVENYCGKKFNKNENLNVKSILHRLKEFHLLNNGFSITWQAKRIDTLFGGFNFIPIEEIYDDYSNQLYFEEDLEEDPLIVSFRPFDEISPEVRCGFIDHPTETIKSIFLHTTSSNYGIQDLDIDFDGYIELMKMCWAYNNWPFILLNIQEEDDNLDEFDRSNKELVKNFKQNMPKVFSNFSWDNFVKKYNSLRLSKKPIGNNV